MTHAIGTNSANTVYPLVQNDWREQFQALQQEQRENPVHPIEKGSQRHQDLLYRFMDIFRMAPEGEKKWLLTQSFFPQNMQPLKIIERFYFVEEDRFSPAFASIETACPIHSIFYLGESEILEELEPYLTEADFEIEGPYNMSLLHMLILGNVDGAPQWTSSTKRCAEILLSRAPNVRHNDSFSSWTPQVYAQNMLDNYNPGNEKKILLESILDVIAQSEAMS